MYRLVRISSQIRSLVASWTTHTDEPSGTSFWRWAKEYGEGDTKIALLLTLWQTKEGPEYSMDMSAPHQNWLGGATSPSRSKLQQKMRKRSPGDDFNVPDFLRGKASSLLTDLETVSQPSSRWGIGAMAEHLVFPHKDEIRRDLEEAIVDIIQDPTFVGEVVEPHVPEQDWRLGEVIPEDYYM